jgi:hypothetical protein
MTLFEWRCSGFRYHQEPPSLEELLVSFTDLHTPMHPGIVSSGPRDYRYDFPFSAYLLESMSLIRRTMRPSMPPCSMRSKIALILESLSQEKCVW